jgi:hypothetical protein
VTYIMSMMKHLLALAILAVAVTACSPSAPPPPRVAVWQGETSGLLFMRVISTDALRDARLTTPDGRRILAQRVGQPEPAPASGESWAGRPSVGVGGSAGSSGGFGTGIGLSFPVGGFGGGSGGQTSAAGRSTQVEFALDQALLRDYRSQPSAWQLELNFGSRVDTLPAPALP